MIALHRCIFTDHDYNGKFDYKQISDVFALIFVQKIGDTNKYIKIVWKVLQKLYKSTKILSFVYNSSCLNQRCLNLDSIILHCGASNSIQ